MAQARVESVPTPDGAFDLPLWLPPSGSGPGLLLIQIGRASCRERVWR